MTAWIPLSALEPGFDANKAGSTIDADGRETIPVAEGLSYVAHPPDGRVAVTELVDTTAGRTFRVTTELDRPLARQAFEGGEPSTDLIGSRVMYVYSAHHAYEHVYLNEHFYTWQCLRGPERGLADTDPATVHRVRDGIYVIGWREKVVPCAAVVAINLNERRSHGMLFGLDDTGAGTVHFTFGAYATPLGRIQYPAGYHP